MAFNWEGLWMKLFFENERQLQLSKLGKPNEIENQGHIRDEKTAEASAICSRKKGRRLFRVKRNLSCSA